MSLEKLTKNYASYNAWANATLVNYLRTKPQQLLSQEIASSFPSIIKTLHHILVAQEFWLSVISGIKNDRDRDENDPFEIEEVLNTLVENSIKLHKIAEGFTEAHLQKEVKTPWRKNTMPKYDVIQHCINHNSYHRGQLTTIFRQLGFTDIANIDYYEFLKVSEENASEIRELSI